MERWNKRDSREMDQEQKKQEMKITGNYHFGFCNFVVHCVPRYNGQMYKKR